MFRDSGNSPMDKSKFGVGSLIVAGSKIYLVVSPKDKEVAVMSCETFQCIRNSMQVTGINFLTSSEARTLIDKTVGDELQYTFTDFNLLPEGVKFKDFSKIK